MTSLQQLAGVLRPELQNELGLVRADGQIVTYRQVWHAATRLAEVGSVMSPENVGAVGDTGLAALANSLIDASRAVACDMLGVDADFDTVTTDWTDHAAYGRYDSGVDPDARHGQRKVKEGRKGKTEPFYGFNLHLHTATSRTAPAAPSDLIVAVNVQPAATSPNAVLSDYAQMQSAFGIADIIVDRGYSQGVYEKWAGPLQQLGLHQTFEPEDHQRAAQDDQGAKSRDGFWYCPCTPSGLVDLERPRPNHPDRIQLLGLYEERNKYRLGVHGKNHINMRLVCPARLGKVRCPRRPESMTISDYSKPTIPVDDTPAPAVCTQATVSIRLTSERLRASQALPPFTRKWRATYGRGRNGVERANSNLKRDLGLKRSSCRAFGAKKLLMAITFFAAASNLLIGHRTLR